MAACTDATGVEPDDIAGTWTATAMVFTSVEDAELTADLADEQATLTLVLDAVEGFTLTFTMPGQDDEIDEGTYDVVGSDLRLSDSIELTGDVYTIARDGDTMTLTILDEFEFEPDVASAATLVITLTR